MGKGKSQETPKRETPQQSARDVLQAQLETMPQAQQLAFQLASDPTTGLIPTAQLQERARREVFPEESGIRQQLLGNISGLLAGPDRAAQTQALQGLQEQRAQTAPGLTNLQEQLTQSVLANLAQPTGISPEQQAFIDQRRQRTQEDLIRSIRERANLGGGLFGGREAQRETRGVSELLQAFAEEDINRQERARLNAQTAAQQLLPQLRAFSEQDVARLTNEQLNAINAALPALQILFPGAQISGPQFQSPVTSGTAAFQGAIGQRGQDIGLQQQQLASQAQMQSALFQALGNAIGGKLSQAKTGGTGIG